MEELKSLLGDVRIPDKSSKIYKDECAFSFTTPESEEGLFVDLYSWIAYSKEYALWNQKKTNHRVYLHIKRIRTEIKEEIAEEPPKKKPTILAIGVEGGFADEEKKFTTEEFLSIVILPSFQTFPLTDANIPEKIQKAVTAILASDSATKQESIQQWTEERKVSKYAETLKQLENGVKIPPKGWKCSKCELTENLWLNITDGTILCGRKVWDGSGGNGHALEYFQSTGYPLVVKLGTISPNSPPDVYSYAEDDMVLDPKIEQHIAHFGININQMVKTEKTIAELEIDQNMTFDWNRIQEQDKQLIPLYGPGFTGLSNLGNSCYMASVVQVLFSLPEFQKRYFSPAEDIFKSSPSDPNSDLQTQLAKIATGLLSGKYSKPDVPEKNENGIHAIPPRSFKSVVGKGHNEFSTMRQQDALEYFQYLMTLIERDEHKREGGKLDPSKIFRFKVEERIEDSTSHQVKYSYREDNVLSLPIPLEKASNLEEVAKYEAKKQMEREEREKLRKEGIILPNIIHEEPVRPKIKLEHCLQAFAASEIVNDFYSTALHSRTTAIRQTRLGTFPDYLVIQMRKFYVSSDWTPKKMDVFIEVPQEINIEYLRGTGLKPNEVLLPESDAPAPKEPEFIINEEIVAQIMSMGFPRNRSEKAVFNTKNEGADQAMNWLFSHMDDPDIDEPLKKPKPATKSEPAFEASEEGIMMITSMGFPKEKALKALKATNNNIERATDWIFSHMDDDDGGAVEESSTSKPNESATDLKDGRADYQLHAFVSHMGMSTMSGHYVAHIKKDGKWVLFNDNKVALSENPPTDMGYIYIFKRKN